MPEYGASYPRMKFISFVLTFRIGPFFRQCLQLLIRPPRTHDLAINIQIFMPRIDSNRRYIKPLDRTVGLVSRQHCMLNYLTPPVVDSTYLHDVSSATSRFLVDGLHRCICTAKHET